MITNPIFDMFARSPLRPLQTHMLKANECAQSLLPFFEETLSNNWSKAEQAQLHITTLEHEADELKRDLRLHLPKGLFLPVSRTDILELLTAQDTVANKAKDIAGLMLGRRMQIPATLADDFRLYLQLALKACDQAKTAISELDELLEAGFRDAEIKLVAGMIHRLDEIEHESDQQQVIIRQKLFKLENDLPPVDVMFLYKVIDSVGTLADHAQQVGGRLQLLLAR